MGDLFGGVLGAVLAAVAAILALLFAEPLIELMTPRRRCPECGTKIPRFRGIASWRSKLVKVAMLVWLSVRRFGERALSHSNSW